MKLIATICLLAIYITHPFAYAQEHHSQAEIFLEYPSFQQGMKVGLYIDLEPNWHTYWTNAGQTGMGPVFDIQADGLQTSKIYASAPMRISSPTAESFAYENEVLFYKEINLPESTTQDAIEMSIRADWLVCKDVCIPNSKTFDITISAQTSSTTKAHHIFADYIFPMPTKQIQANIHKSSKTVTITNIAPAHTIDLFPTSPDHFQYIQPLKIQHDGAHAVFTYAEINAEDHIPFTLVGYNQNKQPIFSHLITGSITNQAPSIAETNNLPIQNKTHPLILVFLFSFIGGLLLNLMPCVFPVISLKFFKVASFSKQEKQKLIRSNLFYTLGVVTSFLALAFTLVFLRSIGNQLGWGFQLQSPTSVALMICLFYIIGMNFLGIFEFSQVPLPQSVQKNIHLDGHIGDFFTGVFTTAVATPCTAPFMAASIGYALSQKPWIIFVTFTMLGLGLSFPYLLLSMFPQLATKLPKPGNWMNTLKEIMAIPMFLTCAWLIWVYSKLTPSIYLLYLLIGLVGIETAFRSFAWTKHRIIGVLIALISIGSVFYLSMTSHKVSSQSIQWIDFSPAKVQALTQDHDFVFIDFTADWCLTCKANEAITFSSKKVQEAVLAHDIQMVKADWTQKDPIITQTLEKYGRVGVPFYLLYLPNQENPKILPSVLTPSIFLDSLKSQ